jgi:hypothetical protein
MTRQATLGSLIDSQRKVGIMLDFSLFVSLAVDMSLTRISQQTRSPVRRGSVLFGTGSMTDISARAYAYILNRF